MSPGQPLLAALLLLPSARQEVELSESVVISPRAGA